MGRNMRCKLMFTARAKIEMPSADSPTRKSRCPGIRLARTFPCTLRNGPSAHALAAMKRYLEALHSSMRTQNNEA